jgi:propanediol utilization protein
MRLRVHGSCPTTFEGIICRVSKDVKLEVHLDTDEGNASDLANAARVELEKM